MSEPDGGSPGPSADGGPSAEGGQVETADAPRPGLFARLRGWVAGRSDQAEANWRHLDQEFARTRLLGKVVALHLRYVFGYLSFGFLISAPIQLGLAGNWGAGLVKSLTLGLACVVPFLVLYPFSRIDWSRMRIPEFKNLELGLTRYATYGAVGFLLAAIAVNGLRWVRPEGAGEQGWLAWALDTRVAWVNLGLMFFAWVRVKFHTLLFREFYTLKDDDDLVLRVPPSGWKRWKTDRVSREAVREEAAKQQEGAAGGGASEGTERRPPDVPDVPA